MSNPEEILTYVTSLKVVELKDELKKRHLSYVGNKQVLAQRLRDELVKLLEASSESGAEELKEQDGEEDQEEEDAQEEVEDVAQEAVAKEAPEAVDPEDVDPEAVDDMVSVKKYG